MVGRTQGSFGGTRDVADLSFPTCRWQSCCNLLHRIPAQFHVVIGWACSHWTTIRRRSHVRCIPKTCMRTTSTTVRASSCADQLSSCGGKIIVGLICWTDSRHSTAVVRRSHIYCTPRTSLRTTATTRRARSCALASGGENLIAFKGRLPLPRGKLFWTRSALAIY